MKRRNAARNSAILEHAISLWQEESAYAAALMEKRKTLATLYAILIGFGAFRIQLAGAEGDVWLFSATWILVIRILLSLTIAAFAVGGYYLYTERSWFRPLLLGRWRSLKRLVAWLWGHLRGRPGRQLRRPRKGLLRAGTGSRARAFAVMLPAGEDIGSWFEMRDSEVAELRAYRLASAYKELSNRNLRVASRIKVATFWLLAGFLFLFLTFGCYLWAIGGSDVRPVFPLAPTQESGFEEVRGADGDDKDPRSADEP